MGWRGRDEYAASIWPDWVWKDVHSLWDGTARCGEAHGWKSVRQVGCTHVYL